MSRLSLSRSGVHFEEVDAPFWCMPAGCCVFLEVLALYGLLVDMADVGLKKKLVIIGNGMAAGRMLDELISRRGLQKYAITVIGDEIHGSYNRILLSTVLAGETSTGDIVQKNREWYRQRGIRFLAGVRVQRLLPSSRQLLCDNGEQVQYDHAIFATGARPSRIPAGNQALEGVMAFRTLDDVNRIQTLAQSAKTAVVVGGGLLGLEAAYGIACRGLKVVLVHRSQHLLSRQLDPGSGRMLAKVMALKGVDFRLGTEITRFNGESSVESAVLTSGEILPCDLAVVATGITPNAELAIEAGLKGGRGIEVDDYLRTSDEFISAIGECIEHKGQTFGLVEPIWQHCQVVAERLTSDALSLRFKSLPVATKLKVSGVQVFSAGQWLTSGELRACSFTDEACNTYRKLLLKDGRIVGIVLFGDVRDGQYFFELMQKKVNVTASMPQLLMGRAYCPTLPELEVQTA